MIKLSARTTGLDHILASVGGILAVYSAGQSIGKEPLGLLFAIGIAAGSFLGYVLGQIFSRAKWTRIDNSLYALCALISAIFARQLNGLLPDEGFPAQLLIIGILSWMLLLGSVFTWRDSNLLFQSVPTIALFGLVGCFDVVKLAPAMFFIFLICAATLFSRVHMRAMLGQAAYAEGVSRDNEQDLLNRLSRGPWQWMAGPAWALGSAAVVCLLSIAGAPIIQRSVQSVAGAVRLATPTPPTSAAAAVTPTFAAGDATLAIGQGPRGNMRQMPVLLAALDQPRYLRGNAFPIFDGTTWLTSANQSQISRMMNNSRRFRSERRFYDPRTVIEDPMLVEFELVFVGGNHDKVYTPGEPWSLNDGEAGHLFLPDGTIRSDLRLTNGVGVSGSALVPKPTTLPSKTAIPDFGPPRWAEDLVDASLVNESVKRLALNAVRKQVTDFDKAMAIKRTIERRVRYNINAEATPSGKDPIYWFLFESQEGYCDLFASTMTLMARSVGLPARVATGFYPILNQKDSEGFYVLRDTDYHAWCEIYFDKLGWVVFDATEGASEVPGSGRGAAASDHRPWYQQPLFIKFLYGIGGAFALAMIFMLVAAFRATPIEIRIAKPTEAATLYAKFAREIERKTGKQRRLSQSPREYLETTAPLLGDAIGPATLLTDQFEAALFSGANPDVKSLSAQIRQFKLIRRPKSVR